MTLFGIITAATSIIDGPTGIGCPVIASIGVTDAVLIVMEPTVSGVYDLTMAIDLAEYFRINTKVLINKFDINDEISEEIGRKCEKKDTPVHWQNPLFYRFYKSPDRG